MSRESRHKKKPFFEVELEYLFNDKLMFSFNQNKQQNNEEIKPQTKEFLLISIRFK